MKLQTGITELLPSWETILTQIGIPFSIVSGNVDFNINSFAVLIVNSKTDKELSKKIYDFVEKGGTILTEADIAEYHFDINIESRNIKYFYSKNDLNFPDLPECDLITKSKIALNSNSLKDQNGKNTTLVLNKGKGKIIVFPSGLVSQIHNDEIKRKNFYSPWSKKETNERVSKVSKGVIKYYIQSALENLYHHRNLPFVNLWHFPDGEKNIFGFRIDTDFAKKEDVKNLYQVLNENKINGTWFVETASALDWINVYSELENQEISLHCYRHKNFSDFDKSFNDIKKGIEILDSINLFPEGYAAPYGEWNSIKEKVLKELDFNYSSEFGFAYDALPLFPFFDEKFSKVLQIPIHPVSSNRLFAGGHNDEGILNYYNYAIEKKINLFEPVFLYTHPAEKRLQIFNSIFERINNLRIPSLTFKQYSDWWKERERIKFSAEIINGEIKLNTENKNSSFWLRVSFPGNENYLSPLHSNTEINTKKIDSVKFNMDYEDQLSSFKKTTLRMRWHDYLFNYRKLKQ